ncbi:MAG: hypothetical protein LBM93_05640, partial [Oscillospiraceae bacterium]|nr:hypothetical protein [Oscillospiraceae bacterium]
VRFTGLRADVLTGERADVEKYIKGNPADNLVGSHSLFNQNIFWEWVRNQQEKFQLLIVDESSVLGNLKTDISKNAKEVWGLFERVIFLNATPFEAKLNTFYSQLSLLDDSLLPVKTKFEKEYCKFDYRGMYPKPTGKYKNQDKFRWLTGYRYFARTRKAKGGVKADCESKVITVPVSKVQREWLKKSQMTQLVYDCPCAFDESIEFNADNVPKIGGLQKLLENDCKNADSILVFVHYKQAQTYISDWLTEQNYTNRVLCGDTKDNERYGIIDDFKNKKFKILITNVQKGLDFGDCDYCIFYGFDPNPSKMVQFEGRMTRSFDIIGKQVYLLCGEGKETERLNKVIKVRAGAMADFTKTDISCIMDLLLEDL